MENPSFNLASIDPGTDTVGVGIFNICAVTFELLSIDAIGLEASRFSKDYYSPFEARDLRLDWLESVLTDIFFAYNPLVICAESNFLKMKTVSAYGPLVESVARIRRAVSAFNATRTLYMVTPQEGKFSVGAERKSKAESLLPFVEATLGKYYKGDIPLSQLDEHALDSIVIGYAQYLKLVEKWRGPPIDLLAIKRPPDVQERPRVVQNKRHPARRSRRRRSV